MNYDSPSDYTPPEENLGEDDQIFPEDELPYLVILPPQKGGPHFIFLPGAGVIDTQVAKRERPPLIRKDLKKTHVHISARMSI